MTGNLEIIKNGKLRSLLTKGPKYREKERINWDKVRNCIFTGIDDCVSNWAKYENVDIKVFSEWGSNLKDLVNKKIISILKTKKLRNFSNPICLKTLNRPEVKSDLRSLHRRFVLFPRTSSE